MLDYTYNTILETAQWPQEELLSINMKFLSLLGIGCALRSVEHRQHKMLKFRGNPLETNCTQEWGGYWLINMLLKFLMNICIM